MHGPLGVLHVHHRLAQLGHGIPSGGQFDRCDLAAGGDTTAGGGRVEEAQARAVVGHGHAQELEVLLRGGEGGREQKLGLVGLDPADDEGAVVSRITESSAESGAASVLPAASVAAVQR